MATPAKRFKMSSTSSDDESSNNLGRRMLRSSTARKSKELCKKLLNTVNKSNSDSEDYEVSEYDSDVDPEFKYSDESENEDGEERAENASANSSCSEESVISNITEFDETFDMLERMYNNEILVSKECSFKTAESFNERHVSKKKLSDECKGIYGAAELNFWEGKYDEAQEQCARIIKEFPLHYGAYEILSRIHVARGDHKKASQFFFTSAMCDPKNSEKWLLCIENTEGLEGLEKAIQITKLAMNHCNTINIREKLAELLEKGGYEKEAMKRKLTNFEMSASEKNPTVISDIVEELFYLSEKFYVRKDVKRSCKCLEIVNMKYPTLVTDEQRFSLLKQMFAVNRYHGILDVVKNIKGVEIDLNYPSNLLSFTTEISYDNRRQIIYYALFASIHLEMTVFIESPRFILFMKDIMDKSDWYLNICHKLYAMKHYKISLNLLENPGDMVDKLASLKLFGKCQEALGFDNDALCTYDNIINNVTGQDASIWELKANLLYRLKREDDAIQVLAESQKFIYINLPQTNLVSRCKPNKDSIQLLYKLCNLLYKEKRFEDFIKVSWKFLFIDSYEYFQINKVELCCEDIAFAKTRISEIQNNIWLGISRTLDANGHCVFATTHLKMGDGSTYDILKKLLDLFVTSEEDYSELLELLSQWGLVLTKILNWTQAIRLNLSVIYVSTAIRNRIKNYRLRRDISGNMIFQELRILKNKYGENIQFWNLFLIYTYIIGTSNERFVLRNLPVVKNNYPVEMINAGSILIGSAKLSLAINSKLFDEHCENPQLCLHLSITLINSALSRNCRQSWKLTSLAFEFMKHYKKLRGNCQETYYNFGRFYHRIKCEERAINCYEKCLSCPPVGNTDHEKSLNDLSREAAFNLVYIYKGRNQRKTVQHLTQKYLTI